MFLHQEVRSFVLCKDKMALYSFILAIVIISRAQSEICYDTQSCRRTGLTSCNGNSYLNCDPSIHQCVCSPFQVSECQTKGDCFSRCSPLLVSSCENGTCMFSLPFTETQQETTNMNVDVGSLQTELNALKTKLSALEERVGQTYIRWGRTSCPLLNGTEFVYNGFMAGNKWDQHGGGSNHLCLPGTPSWGKYVDGYNGGSEIRGTEIEVASSVSQQLFGKEANNQDIPCSVCRSNRASKVMIPGRTACSDGWVMQYSGYIVASAQTWAANSDYVCVDSGLQFVTGGAGNNNENVVKPVEVRVGSLPHPPYVDGRELPCVVCTK